MSQHRQHMLTFQIAIQRKNLDKTGNNLDYKNRSISRKLLNLKSAPYAKLCNPGTKVMSVRRHQSMSMSTQQSCYCVNQVREETVITSINTTFHEQKVSNKAWNRQEDTRIPQAWALRAQKSNGHLHRSSNFKVAHTWLKSLLIQIVIPLITRNQEKL